MSNGSSASRIASELVTDDDRHCADLLRSADPDRWLIALWCPVAARASLVALFALDVELARVVETTTEPMIGRIRLAWWREQLEALGTGSPPAHPVLRALSVHPAALPGHALAALEDGALAWLDGDLDGVTGLRGTALFALAARVLGGGDPGSAGPAWAAGAMRRAGLAVAPVAPPRTLPRRLRPLLALARLGARPIDERAGAPVRQLAIARTMLLG